jgi:hypothetical protein
MHVHRPVATDLIRSARFTVRFLTSLKSKLARALQASVPYNVITLSITYTHMAVQGIHARCTFHNELCKPTDIYLQTCSIAALVCNFAGVGTETSALNATCLEIRENFTNCSRKLF